MVNLVGLFLSPDDPHPETARSRTNNINMRTPITLLGDYAPAVVKPPLRDGQAIAAL
jgi:hypothetical protein